MSRILEHFKTFLTVFFIATQYPEASLTKPSNNLLVPNFMEKGTKTDELKYKV